MSSEETARLVRALASHAERRAWFGERRVARSVLAAPAKAAAAATGGAAPMPKEAPAVRDHRDPRHGEAIPREQAAPRSAARPAGPAPGSTPGSTLDSAPGDDEVRRNREIAAACTDLASLRSAVARCDACELCTSRTQTVFADGPDRARVMFVGEAPGENEDRQGVPFVGRAGQLLTDIITKGMGLSRAEVSIVNVLKCRPPHNRDPEPREKARCTPFLDRQIELVDPEVLITLGLHASQHVLERKESMGRLRGQVHTRQGRKVIATYHPAYLLRSPGMKKDCWQDIQLAMAELGLDPPKRG